MAMSRDPKERPDPFNTFTDDGFRCRYRLPKAIVKDLALEFGNSEFATKGKRNGKGLSHRERVSEKWRRHIEYKQ